MATKTTKTAKPATRKTNAKPPVAAGHATKAKWRKPQAGTMRGRVLAAMCDEPRTVAEIAAAAGVPENRVLPHIYATWRDQGDDFRDRDVTAARPCLRKKSPASGGAFCR